MQLVDKKAVTFSYFIQILIFHRMVAKGLDIFLRVLKKIGCWFGITTFDLRNKSKQLKLEKRLAFLGVTIMLFSENLQNRLKIKI